VSIDLELVSTDDLWDEIAKRFDHSVLCALSIPDEETQKIVRYKSGNSVTCAGLASNLEHYLHNCLIEEHVPLPGDDGIEDDDEDDA